MKPVEVPSVARAPRPCLPGAKKSTGGAPVPRNGPGPAFGSEAQARRGKVGILVGGRIKYIDRPGYVAPPAAAPLVPLVPVKKGKSAKPPFGSEPQGRRQAAKMDAKFLAKARELRDRYLEHVNAGGGTLLARESMT